MKTHSQMEYRSFEWTDGTLVFTDLALFDPSFQAYIERAEITLDFSSFPQKLKGHIFLESPHISISKYKARDVEDSWFDFSIFVGHGTLDWGGLVHFSLNKTDASTSFTLDWDDASALISMKEGQIQGVLENVYLPLIKPWVPIAEITEGRLSGRFTVHEDGTPISCNVGFDDVTLNIPHARASKVNGTVSFNASIGAKWILEGIAAPSKASEFPFECEGRGFFKSDWIETKIAFQHSWAMVSGIDIWNFECHRLNAQEASFLQAIAATQIPDINELKILKGQIDSKGSLSLPNWNVEFAVDDLSIEKDQKELQLTCLVGDFNQDGGSFSMKNSDFYVEASGLWEQWQGAAATKEAMLKLKGGWDGERVPIEITEGKAGDFSFHGVGWVDPEFDLSFSISGVWDFLEKKIPFKCPNLSKIEEEWTVDFRFCRDSWDLMRIYGIFDGSSIAYSPKSHFLGAPLTFLPTNVEDLDISLQLPWDHILAAGPFLKEWGFDIESVPALGTTDLHFQMHGGSVELEAIGSAPEFRLNLFKREDSWIVALDSKLKVQATLNEQGRAKGEFDWEDGVSATFDGKITPALECEFSLPKARFDLSLLKDERFQGVLNGSGHIIYNGEIESDFDFIPSSLVIHEHPMENDGVIHLNYSSLKGALFRGLNLHGPFDCIIDVLQYQKERASWVFQNSKIHIPASFLYGRVLEFIDPDKDLNFTADLDFASDFSTVVCKMKEGFLPINDEYHRIENLELFWNEPKCEASFLYKDHLCKTQLQIGEDISGRLILGIEENPLTIDWEFKEELRIHSIEGDFAGISASFHAEEENVLVGSTHVNFNSLATIIPQDVGDVFRKMEMGQGYELKGRLDLKKRMPHFRGILSGKAIELFGFQFRTLLAQADLSLESIRIYDIKVSDSAGMLKVDELLIEGSESRPYTIHIPNLTMTDFRPSFLLRPGGALGPIDPLVVRELKLTEFKGVLADGNTWTADGNLHFINSYKRGETVFDAPANLLSRIAGLDFELLIPVTGDLKFDLKNGNFNLLELTNAYSEGKRSEFFLEMDPPPRMDLDGNLKISLKMKQFVLLKFTESFIISIDGVLDEPDFHLTKKKFLGIF